MNPLEPEGKIFISYRRADSPGVAGRLADSLKAYFGEDRVFRDVGGIRAGAKFDEVIDKTLTGTDAVIVLIGPNWLNASNDEGASRRLDDPADILSREIEFALKSGVPVFPVLVEDTRMPSRAELPEKLAALARLNGISITDERWEQDVTRLAKIVAIDIPGSVAERKLARMRLMVLAVLLGVTVFSTIRFTWTSYGANFFMLSSNDRMTSTQVEDLRKEAVPSQRTLIDLHLLPGKRYYADNFERWTDDKARTEWHVRFEDIYGTRFRFFNPLASVINYIGIALS
ncbi:MAG: toll/interleukin-1 receptor domain-containing protein, partial [Gemmatimonadetes bacterium]|nr:toll/interleukin-1 receptor domain-containing protein [Gemmatimonadota bacterium]